MKPAKHGVTVDVTKSGCRVRVASLPGCDVEGPSLPQAMDLLADKLAAHVGRHGPTPALLEALQSLGIAEWRPLVAMEKPRAGRSRARTSPAAADALQLKVTLRNARPPIWRRVMVPSDMPLDRLHDVLQIAMGWTDSHLHAFVAGGTSYMPASVEEFGGPPGIDERSVTVGELLTRPKDRMLYEYDFGDDWEHDVVVEKVLKGGATPDLPRVIDGRRACPPEDVGGSPGYAEYLQAIANPRHPGHVDMLEWGGEFDPEAWDLAAAEAALRRARGRRMTRRR